MGGTRQTFLGRRYVRYARRNFYCTFYHRASKHDGP